MMTKRGAVALLGALTMAPAGLFAHEGHEHKVMGTVAAIQADRIEVAPKEGDKVMAVVTKDTKFLRGKATASAADVKVGERVVLVYVQEKDGKSATQILLGDAAVGDARKH